MLSRNTGHEGVRAGVSSWAKEGGDDVLIAGLLLAEIFQGRQIVVPRIIDVDSGLDLFTWV